MQYLGFGAWASGTCIADSGQGVARDEDPRFRAITVCGQHITIVFVDVKIFFLGRKNPMLRGGSDVELQLRANVRSAGDFRLRVLGVGVKTADRVVRHDLL